MQPGTAFMRTCDQSKDSPTRVNRVIQAQELRRKPSLVPLLGMLRKFNQPSNPQGNLGLQEMPQRLQHQV